MDKASGGSDREPKLDDRYLRGPVHPDQSEPTDAGHSRESHGSALAFALPQAERASGAQQAADVGAAKVKSVAFSDLYLGHPLLGDRFCDVPGAAVNPMPASKALSCDIEQLKAACNDARSRSPSLKEFRVNHDGVAYRAFVMNSLSGQVLVLRKIADDIPSLTELGIPHAYIRHLMSSDLTGLLVVSGGMKSGRTTTACALVKERLSEFGGVAVTSEDPIELPLEGNHGQGICYQTPAAGNGNFAEAFRHIVRWGAKTIFVGEIRDPATAAEVLQASVSGHLVITTAHGDNVIRTIMKLQTMASEVLEQSTAQTMLADGLAGVLHQKLTLGPKKKLETEFLFLKDAEFARTNIRIGKYEMLASDIKQQMASMIAENAMAQRRTGA